MYVLQMLFVVPYIGGMYFSPERLRRRCCYASAVRDLHVHAALASDPRPKDAHVLDYAHGGVAVVDDQALRVFPLQGRAVPALVRPHVYQEELGLPHLHVEPEGGRGLDDGAQELLGLRGP